MSLSSNRLATNNADRIITNTNDYIYLNPTGASQPYQSISDFGVSCDISNLESLISYCSDSFVKITCLWSRDYHQFLSMREASLLQTAGFYNSSKEFILGFDDLKSKTYISLDLERHSGLNLGSNLKITAIDGVPFTLDTLLPILDDITGETIGSVEFTFNSTVVKYTPIDINNAATRLKRSKKYTISYSAINDFNPTSPITNGTITIVLGYDTILKWNHTIYCTDRVTPNSEEGYYNQWIFTPHVSMEIFPQKTDSLSTLDVIDLLYHLCPITMVLNKVYVNNVLQDFNELYEDCTKFEKWILGRSLIGGATPMKCKDPLSTILYQ